MAAGHDATCVEHQSVVPPWQGTVKACRLVCPPHTTTYEHGAVLMMTEYRRPRRDVCGAPERSSSVARHRKGVVHYV
ncbi:hypothetical protein J6590_022801 [Homalodisca vitripennis]|nr:hypothetical protein J6590_022801 [Homalodisca vitripennis]